MITSLGCSDYKISQITEELEPGVTAPEIEVDPTYHNYGALSAGSETQDVVITLKTLEMVNLTFLISTSTMETLISLSRQSQQELLTL